MIVQVWGLPREEYFIQSVFSKLHRQVLTDEKIRRYIFRRTNLSHGNQPVPLPLDFPQGCPSNSTSHRRLAQPLGAGPGSDSRPALPAALCRRRAASTSPSFQPERFSGSKVFTWNFHCILKVYQKRHVQEASFTNTRFCTIEKGSFLSFPFLLFLTLKNVLCSILPWNQYFL